MKSITIQPIFQVNGTIKLPGSKSISNRALLLSALANGTTVLNNLLDSDDVHHMLNSLKILKVNYRLSKNNTYCKVIGKGSAFNIKKPIKLFVGNAGTVIRSLTAVLCLGKNDVILTGEKKMKTRPIAHLVDALRQGGARIDYIKKKGYPPLHLYGGFNGGKLTVNGGISSQFLTALLLTAPLASKDTTILIEGELVSKPYIDITLHLIKIFGVIIENQSYHRFIIHGNQKYQSPGNYSIEGDASSASYFLAAAAIKGGTVKVLGIGRNTIQGDVDFVNILNKMGAIVIFGDNFISCTRNKLNAIDIDGNHIPDVAMTIAIVALFAKGTTVLRNIYNWHVKETDRLFAISTELRKVGARIEEGKDYIRITPPISLLYAKINTYGDHRMAMCFSLVALSNVSVTILNPKCTKKTFPDYFNQLAKISIIA